jgi:hypothetical protein
MRGLRIQTRERAAELAVRQKLGNWDQTLGGHYEIRRMAQVAFVALLLLMGFARACFAETGTVGVVFARAVLSSMSAAAGCTHLWGKEVSLQRFRA